ncbi:alpha-glucosidase [Hydrotalea sp.]|uniref:glycoside hydrolase family 13 protein n=1 Tax=Hydrotalea sp. TaxID=2881279 RepID=UPI0025899CE4|nr:alpha-glucosidase [Hydrotalea sp.]
MKQNILAIFLLCLTVCAENSNAQSELPKADANQKWWKEAIVYQIYPRSFKDSNGDGVGDLKGIISELDYIKSLGVDVVWLNPIYQSPNFDNGYDVSDYRKILPEFGTMADFDSLLNGMHRRGIKLVMDLVVNHSSNEHEWFQKSRSSRNNPYRNYYHWWNAENGKPPYRYSLFDINHDAWKYDTLTNAYYLHYFSDKQPDLNWENPKVRNEVYNIMRFWADKGIDGFRLDAFQFVAKDTTFPMFPKGFEKDFTRYYAMQGNIHGYLQQMNQQIFSKYDVMSVAEGAGNTFEDAHNLVDSNRHELNIAYAFNGVDLAKPNGYSLLQFKSIFSQWDSAFEHSGWLAVFLANHDQARMVSRFGNDLPQFRTHSSQMLSTFLLTMRGTPFYYNGDELGMTNPKFSSIHDYRDQVILDEYKHTQMTGGNVQALLKNLSFGARDNGRTPFQWDSSRNAGFTTGMSWIGINANYKTVNVAVEENDPNSCLHYFRKLVQLRKNNPTLVYGKYTLLDKANPQVYAYLREDAAGKFLILLNFSAKDAVFSSPTLSAKAKVVLANYVKTPITITLKNKMPLRPYEAMVIRL